MAQRVRSNINPIVRNRFAWFSGIVIVLGFILCFRLWYMQVFRFQYFLRLSEQNRIRKIEIPAPRGNIFDRNGKVIVGNRPYYDLVIVPQYQRNLEKTLDFLASLLAIPVESFESSIYQTRSRPKYEPVILKRNLTVHEVSLIEVNRIFLPGVEVKLEPRREYTKNIPTHLIGYLSEASQAQLDRFTEEFPDKDYRPGDLVGKQGLELKWEPYLRGKRGFRLIQVDAFGRQISASRADSLYGNDKLPTSKAIKGSDIQLTLDLDLQAVAKEAFQGKYGAVVVLNPQTGEVLAMVSEPTYDPEMYQRSFSQGEWNSLLRNPFKPLFDKTTGGEYIPGSIYKAVVALAGLQEKAVNVQDEVYCPGYFRLGDQVLRCWEKNGHGRVNIATAVKKSCDVFFYELGIKLGVDTIAQYAKGLGLGKKLGFDVNLEKDGLIPTSEWKKNTYNEPWLGGDTPNIAIGQGYNLLTPLQMASLYSAIANGGKVYKPYIVKNVATFDGKSLVQNEPILLSEASGVSPESFALVRKYLESVVMEPDGTGKNAAVPGQTVAGKTGSAQVVSLRKNANNKNDDVSVKWKEHAIFAAFSPSENAEIAIAVVSENDAFGGGGAQAAPIAGKILNAYWDLKTKRMNQKETVIPPDTEEPPL